MYRWMNKQFGALCPFQQNFSLSGQWKADTTRALRSKGPFRFGKEPSIQQGSYLRPCDLKLRVLTTCMTT